MPMPLFADVPVSERVVAVPAHIVAFGAAVPGVGVPEQGGGGVNVIFLPAEGNAPFASFAVVVLVVLVLSVTLRKLVADAPPSPTDAVVLPLPGVPPYM